MIVKELIKLLQEQNQDAIVVMAKDAEGNSYSPISSLWGGAYLPDSTWSGTAGLLTLTAEDIEAGYGEDDLVDGDPAVILCPVN
jgi:hypothetical protein